MASHISENDTACVCGCCKPRRRRMSRRRRRRSRPCPPRRRRRSQQCMPCRPRRRRSRRRSRRRTKPVCCEYGQSPCAKSCSCGCAECTCMKCNKAALTSNDCNPRSNAFMNFLSWYKRKSGGNRNIVEIAKEAGRIWQDMSHEKREHYNYKSPSHIYIPRTTTRVGEYDEAEMDCRPKNQGKIDESIVQ